MPTKTTFPKGHTRCYYVTKNMSRELLTHAKQIAGLRAAAGMKGATTETVLLDCMVLALPTLEAAAEKKRKDIKR